MTTVQIAIDDRSYAGELCELLVSDGMHCVHLLSHPNPNLQGVVVADEHLVDYLTETQGIDHGRCVVFVRHLEFDAQRLFDAGVRYVIHAGCSPEVGRMIVIAAERQLTNAAIGGGMNAADLLLDPADKLFLQAVGIGHW